MINIQRGYKDWKELSEIVSNVKTLNTFVDLVDGNNRYGITNDLRDRGMIDFNYKSICATIKQEDKYLSLSPSGVEVWGDDGGLDFVYIDNIIEYGNYEVKLRDDGKTQITKISPYDEQEYYYAIDRKVYRKGQLIKNLSEYGSIDDRMNEVDNMILELIEHNKDLQSICAIY